MGACGWRRGPNGSRTTTSQWMERCSTVMPPLPVTWAIRRACDSRQTAGRRCRLVRYPGKRPPGRLRATIPRHGRQEATRAGDPIPQEVGLAAETTGGSLDLQGATVFTYQVRPRAFRYQPEK